MTPDQIKTIQKTIAGMGYYQGAIDGLWGPQSAKAFQDMAASKDPAPQTPSSGLESQLRRDEGEVLQVYNDSLGYATIGVGRLVDGRKGGGITKDESALLLRNDIAKVTAQVKDRLPWSANLSEARLGVLINMAFQMGIAGLLGFKNTLSMIEAGNYAQAADGMVQSTWAKQTPARAKRLAEQMRNDSWE